MNKKQIACYLNDEIIREIRLICDKKKWKINTFLENAVKNYIPYILRVLNREIKIETSEDWFNKKWEKIAEKETAEKQLQNYLKKIKIN